MNRIVVLLVGAGLALAAAVTTPRGAVAQVRGGSPTLRSACEQKCLDGLMSNQDRCYRTNCRYILFFRICNEDGLNACLTGAENVYQACRQECAEGSSPGPRP